MDFWKYFAIGHEPHQFCNPLSEAKVDELIALLALSDEARVLDIACGKAEFLVRTVKRWNCSAVGVFDAAVCLGASWIWAGLEGTLRALSSWAKPGGLVVVGEPFWRSAPSREHLEAAELTESSFGTHLGNAQTGLRLGLGLLHTFVSGEDDWDRYEGYQWYAVEQYSRRNPGDPDVLELMANVRKARDHYLQWGRNEIGWAVYLFLKDPFQPAA
jgi:SAM-dependent methyltransferase